MLFDSFEAYDVQQIRKESREEGSREGRKEGREEGRKEGITAMIGLCRDLGMTSEEIVQQLMQRYHLSETEASELLEM